MSKQLAQRRMLQVWTIWSPGQVRVYAIQFVSKGDEVSRNNLSCAKMGSKICYIVRRECQQGRGGPMAGGAMAGGVQNGGVIGGDYGGI